MSTARGAKLKAQVRRGLACTWTGGLPQRPCVLGLQLVCKTRLTVLFVLTLPHTQYNRVRTR